MRADFLNQFWRRYPSLPSDCWWYGRWRAYGKMDPSLAGDWRPEGLARKGEVPAVDQILLPDDWVALSGPENAPLVTLLAPMLLENPPLEGMPNRALRWQKLMRSVRSFFEEREFIELSTPQLVPCPGSEPFLDPVRVEVDGVQLWLPTSPELHHKKALAHGLQRTYEIARVFRGKELGHRHLCEFHMLEWYRAGESLDSIASDVELLLVHVTGDSTLKLQRTTCAELFKRHLNLELSPGLDREILFDGARALGLSPTTEDSANDLFQWIFVHRIEPEIAQLGQPCLISGYPKTQAALARLGPDGFAERFEVYWKGLELANAFHELNDPVENRARFEADQKHRILLGKPPVGVDDEFFSALDGGLPPSSGVALGVERLAMALWNESDIRRVRPFLGRDLT